MIILINGPFGIGKTSVAHQLIQRSPASILFDPELVGSLLRRTLLTQYPLNDYQDYTLWRKLLVDIASDLSKTYSSDIVVPMCIWRREYFDEIVAGFGDQSTPFMPLRLTCEPETLRRRILGRADEDGGHEWYLEHLEIGLSAANDAHFGIEVEKEGRSVSDIADLIYKIQLIHES